MLQRPQLQRLMVVAVALTAMASGLAAVFTPLINRLPIRISALSDALHPLLIHRALGLFLGSALIYISYQLAERRLAAWWTAAIISSYLLLTSVVFHGYGVLAGLAGLNLAGLMVARRQFTSRSEYRSIRQGLLLLVLSLLFTIGYGIVGFWLLDQRDFGQEFGLRQATMRTLQEYTLTGNGDLVPQTRYARGFLDSLDFMGILGVGFGLYSLFRPLSYTLRTLPHERERMRWLLERHGDYSEGSLKLWPADKSYFLNAGRQAGVGYQVRAGVALAAGAPIGSSSSRRACVGAFSAFCRSNGWDPAFVLVPERGLELFEDGWRRLKIGEDALVPLVHFATVVATNKHFRNIRNRFAKQGYRLAVAQPPHSNELVQELHAVNATWLASGKTQWQFLQGSFDPAYLATGPLYIVRNASGTALAFANGVPTYVRGQATVDMMRQLPTAPSNTMDYLLMEALLASHAAGFSQFSLGLAPLAQTHSHDQTSAEERILMLVGRLNQDVRSIDGLRQFKNKFEPIWESQYVVYRGLPTSLPKIGLALARAMHVSM